jgi:hypothetical protein
MFILANTITRNAAFSMLLEILLQKQKEKKREWKPPNPKLWLLKQNGKKENQSWKHNTIKI